MVALYHCNIRGPAPGSLHAASRDAHAHCYSYPNTNIQSHSRNDAFRYHADWYPHYTCSASYTDVYSYPSTNAGTSRHGDAKPYSYAYSDAHSPCNFYAHTCANTEPDAQARFRLHPLGEGC